MIFDPKVRQKCARGCHVFGFLGRNGTGVLLSVRSFRMSPAWQLVTVVPVVNVVSVVAVGRGLSKFRKYGNSTTSLLCL